MRKVISLGLCALMFFLFSGQVLAGKNQDCEDQKDELKALGLYGLCNAYWNADNENARSQILTNFEEKAGPGGPGMPGLEDECPCWGLAELQSTCSMTYYGGFQNLFPPMGVAQFNNATVAFNLIPGTCVYVNSPLGIQRPAPVDAEQAIACLSDITGLNLDLLCES